MLADRWHWVMDEISKPVKKSKNLMILAGIVITFTGLAFLIVFLAQAGVITVALALLMLVALVGIYFGFGILIAAHLMVSKLD